MTERRNVPLTMLRAGQSGKIVEIQGGPGLINRLNALGIRPGKRVTKVGSMLMRGPVTVQVGGTQVAMGFGMARRVIVEPGDAAR
jgi:ferrous iron transport protein A